MFSMKDICDVAIQIEKNGEHVYRNAQKEAENINIKEMLGWMAEEEARHAKWFAKLAETVSTPITHPEIEEMGKNLLKDSVGGQTFSLSEENLNQARSIKNLIEQSVEFEKDTIIFYEMLREFIDDKEILLQLEIVIQEERNHVVKLNMFIESIPK